MKNQIQDYQVLLADALIELEKAQQELIQLKSQQDETIAIVGMGCRFPGGVTSPEAFWKLLKGEQDAITSIPSERFDIEEFYALEKETVGKIYVKQGGFLENVDLFDAYFFGVSPVEARAIDPQQRMLLEVSWEALENAGIPFEKLEGSQTGVYVGTLGTDYSLKRHTSEHYTAINAYDYIGNSISAAAGRISYFFNFKGPAITIDTGCSAALVSIHTACQSLRSKETDIAIAGGVNLLLAPNNYLAFARMGALSPDGKCKAFDADANGFVRSEGCGIFILKRLKDALQDSDNILAVIKSTAITSDGRSNGLTVPNCGAQQDTIKKALANANLSSSQIDYIECHGTGTVVGDAIELEALSHAFKNNNTGRRPLLIGSVKTNIGHCESASGAAGLMKVVLSLQHRQLPRSLHFHNPNPKINWFDANLKVVDTLTSWQSEEPRRAGLNNFGMSGTNAHIIIEEAPAKEGMKAPLRENYLLPISAKSVKALKYYVIAYKYIFENQLITLQELYDICYTASQRRSHLEHRVVFAFQTLEELQVALQDFIQGNMDTASIAYLPAARHSKRKLAFVFSGQGSQYVGMGKTLLQDEPVFKAALLDCEKAFSPYVNWSLTEELRKDETESRVKDSTEIFQPAIFAIQVALAALWRHYGVTPDAVIGHSLGEITAFYIAGALSLEDAAKIICKRSELMTKLSNKGKVALIGLSYEAAAHRLALLQHEISIAGSNSPEATVISGNPAAVEQFMQDLEEEDIFCRAIATGGVAVHSFQFDPHLEALQQAFCDIQPRKGTIPIYTTSTPTPQVTFGEDATGSYWVSNVRNPVQFSPGIQRLQQDGYDTFVEVSPHPVLTTSLAAIFQENSNLPIIMHSLYKKQSEPMSFFKNLGTLHCMGVKINWQALYPTGNLYTLPAYPWQRQRYWIETEKKSSYLSPLQPTPLALEENLYQIDWEEIVDIPMPTKKTTTKEDWILFSNRSLVQAELLELMMADTTGKIILVEEGEIFQRKEKEKDSFIYTLNPSNKLHYIQLFEDLINVQNAFIRKIIWLTPPNKSINDFSESNAMDIDDDLGTISLLYLSQTIESQLLENTPQLYIITNGSQKVNITDIPELSQAPSWSFGRTISQELPHYRCTRIDLSTMPIKEEFNVLSHILQQETETELAIRKTTKFAARLNRYRHTTHSPIRPTDRLFEANHTYLIVGGLGELGLPLLEWMTKRGATHFALLGRSLPNTKKQAYLEKLEKAGTSIRFFQSDIAHFDEAKQIIDTICQEMPPLHGIFNLAGSLESKSLANMTPRDITTTFHPKVQGTWNLHCLTQQFNLQYFVLFSSLSSFITVNDLGHYAAANTFTNAFSEYRSAHQLPVQAISWGRIASTMGLDTQGIAMLQQLGIESMSIRMYLQYLEWILQRNIPFVGAFQVDFAKYLAFNMQNESLFKDILQELMLVKNEPSSETTWLEKFQLLNSIDDKRALLIDYLQYSLAALLQIPVTEMEPGMRFQSYGLDSIMATQWSSRIYQDTGVKLNFAKLMQTKHINGLTHILLKALENLKTSANDDTSDTDESAKNPIQGSMLQAILMEDVDDLSEEALNALIAKLTIQS